MSRYRRLVAVALLGGVGCWLASLALERSFGEAPWSLVEEGLYVGGAVDRPPPGTRAVVNLCERRDPYAVEHTCWEPIDGSQAPDIDWLWRVVGFIDAQRQAGRTTYVHCLAGVNRSGMVVTAYLMAEHGWDRDGALAFVRSKRPQVQPNPTLLRFLAEWERTLEDQRAGRASP